MGYTALYRKFRPRVFDDVKGQDHIVTTLKNQINANRIGHAYLFSGTRGTGKTSVAKILAQAVNCENPVDGSPCMNCRTCKAILEGSSLNVMEIDAASNNGVDNVRTIREEVSYSPAEGKFKVYIIDEVHMLSGSAFNALLKTLEEPPEYVIFILATTEYHKVPQTILSRCQKYDFHRISIDTITDRLSDLMKEEGVDAEEKALRYIARMGDGSMRDSLSLLDQCLAFYMGEQLTYDKALEVLGAVDTEVFSKLLRAVIASDVSSALTVVRRLADEGRELTQAVNDFTWYLRNLLLVQTADELEDVLDISSENLAVLKEEAQMMETEVLLRYIRVFSELSNNMKAATQKRIMFEVAVIKLCKPEMESSQDSLANRVANLEQKVKNGIPVAHATHSTSNGSAGAEQHVAPTLPKAVPEEVEQVVKIWSSLVAESGGVSRLYFRGATVSLAQSGALLLVTDDANAYKYLNDNQNNCINAMKESIAERIGKTVEIELRLNDSGRPANEAYVDLSQLINTEIDIEEDE